MRILITGANGLLGQKLVHLLKNKNINFLATGRGVNRSKDANSFAYETLDLLDKQAIVNCFSNYQPTVIVHAAAMTQVDDCETNPFACWQANVQATANVLEAAAMVSAHFIHLSTDFIFDGTHGPLAEDAKPNPLSFYGKSKLAAEKLVHDAAIDACILRTMLVYGVAQDLSRSNIVLWAKDALTKQTPIKVVHDQYRTPTLAEDLALACLLAAQKKAKGVYHIAGKDFMSISQLVTRVANYFGLSTQCITLVSSQTLNQPAKRPPKTGFIIDKAEHDLGYQPHSFEEGIAIVMQQIG